MLRKQRNILIIIFIGSNTPEIQYFSKVSVFIGLQKKYCALKAESVLNIASPKTNMLCYTMQV